MSADLLSTGHRVITIDMRGFGRSERPGTGYDPRTFAADVERELAQREVNNVTLVGHSMGGAVAALVASRNAVHVEKLVLVGAAGPRMIDAGDGAGGVPEAVFTGIDAALNSDRPAFMAGLPQAMVNKPLSEPLMVWLTQTALVADPLATRQAISAVGHLDLRPELSKISVPTLIIHGASDKLVPASQAQLWHTGISNSRVVVMPGVGHLPFLEDRNEFMKLLVE